MVTLDPISIPKNFKKDFEDKCITYKVNFMAYQFGSKNQIYYMIHGHYENINLINIYINDMHRRNEDYVIYDRVIQRYIFFYRFKKYFNLLIFGLLFTTIIFLIKG